MANPAIGEIRCPFTGEMSEVCRAKSGKHPLYYRNPRVGIIHGKAPDFQEWVLENAEMFGAKRKEPEPEEKPKEKGFFGAFESLFSDDDEGDE